MKKIFTISVPNNEWIDTINEDLEKASAKVILPIDMYNVTYNRKAFYELACAVSVDMDNIPIYLQGHIQLGNKIYQD